jgi:hypothetical protein
MKKYAIAAGVAACVFSLAVFHADMSVIYYVSLNGNDSNNGTSLSTPFRNIQKCASVMVAGDTCYIRAGTYRETVTPTNSGTSGSPIKYLNYNGESVTISGADQVTGTWSVYSGNIYKINVGSWNFDQLFVDGTMNLKAQWPNNTSLDMLDNSFMASAGSGTLTSITDINIPGTYWNGGKIWMLPGYHWVGFDRDITAYNSTSRTVTFPTVSSDEYYTPAAGDKYYLFDKLEALDVGGEWYLNKTTHDLYLMTTANNSPANHTVEAKARTYALDLSNKSYITADGINLFAGNLNMQGSTNCTVQNGSVKYPDYFENADGYILQNSGIVITGSNNVLNNMEVAHTPGAGINVSGISNQITNNTIHDVDWTVGEYGAISYGVDPKPSVGAHKNLTISHNTIYKTGRSGILGHYSEANTITYNTIYDTGKIGYDLGIIYIDKDGGMEGIPSVFAYNTLHDNNGKGSAIYFDCYTDATYKYCGQNYTLHHNIIYNLTVAWSAAFGINGGDSSLGGRNLKFYNNSTYNVPQSTGSYDGAGTNYSNIEFKNNIATAAWNNGTMIPTMANNFTSGDPLYTNLSAGDFSLQSTSPAVDAGTIIPGITDGYYGSAPDIGAIEYTGATPTPTPF